MSLEMKYFVLKPHAKSNNDPYAIASREAMLTYAEFIKAENPTLCDDLEAWVVNIVAGDALKKEV